MTSRRPKRKRSHPTPNRSVSGDVYGSFEIWEAKRAPQWHAIKKMRYVFWRMMTGQTVTDAIRELHWEARAFWREIDLDRDGKHPFKEEYSQAKLLQSRAMADAVITIAEGRDAITRKSLRATRRVIERSLRKISRTTNKLTSKMLLQQLLADLRERDKIVITRNKLQIDATKWFAAKANPNEFADKSSLGLGGLPHGDGDNVTAITIGFVGPDGKDVPFDPAANLGTSE